MGQALRIGPSAAAPPLATMEMVRAPRIVYISAAICLFAVALLPVALIFVPWRQNIQGLGEVIALDPLDRPQTVEAPVAGRVAHFTITENSYLAEGDLICEIVDIDPLRLQRLEQERRALELQKMAAENQVQQYEGQIQNLELTRTNAVDSAKYRVEMARQRIRSWEEAVKAAEATLQTANQHLVRMQNLFKAQLATQRDLQIAERDQENARADLDSDRAQVEASRNELSAAEQEVERTQNSANAAISSASASRDEAKAKVQDIAGKLAKLATDISRQESQKVLAPRAGRVNRLFVATNGEVVGVKDPLIELVPEAKQYAAQIYVKGMDAPLIQPGDEVRMRFDGWPAVQFAGWPSVAVGTFGGRVRLVDPRDDGKGRFRVIIEPDVNEPPWPSSQYLRQGVRAEGYVLLRDVTLGYEFWRQLNGFPPTVEPKETKLDVARKRVK